MGLAIARPDAAMALARPVGFCVGLFHFGFFLLSDPLSLGGEAVEAVIASPFRVGDAVLEFVEKLDGNSGGTIDVGDSTIGVSLIELSLDSVSGVVAARLWSGTVAMGGGRVFNDLLDVLERSSWVGETLGSLPPNAEMKASLMFDFEDEAVLGRDGGREEGSGEALRPEGI